MIKEIIIKDNDLSTLFRNRIIQKDNFNSNSELFIIDGEVLKVYIGDDEVNKYNLMVIKNILKNQSYLKEIHELVLPQKLFIYKKCKIGFSMPYIKGMTLNEVIENNVLTDEDIKNIFKKLIRTIEKFRKLPFSFYLGDLHEKNIILDNKLNINIIDCNSFIINNEKLIIDDNIYIGKYLNYHFNKEELADISISGDFFCIFCMVINYVYRNIIKDTNNPIDYAIKHLKSNILERIIDKANNMKTFLLTEEDIDDLFASKKEYQYINNNTIEVALEKEVVKELKRIRKI